MNYKPKNTQTLIKHASKLLLNLNIDVTDGVDLIENVIVANNLISNINIYEKIEGEKYQKFIDYVCKKYNKRNNGTMPFTNFNLRYGVYRSIVGMMAEYISLQVTTDLFGSGEILQDFHSQKNGSDIRYYHNDNEITADIKLSNSPMLTVYSNADWFKNEKISTRFHLVDISHDRHYITGRSYLESMNERYGNIIPIIPLKKYGFCKETNIRHLTRYFKD